MALAKQKKITKLGQWFDFLIAMTEKEIKTRYKHAVLGFLWLFLNPVLQMATMGLIFQFFIPVHISNYFLFLFTGLLAWNFFSVSITKCTPVMYYERNLIQKAKFPKEILILSIILSNLFHFLIALAMLNVLLIGDKFFFEHYSLLATVLYSARTLLSLLGVFWITILTVGCSLICASLNVRYRDTYFVILALIPLWFYLTPIVYSLDLLPQQLQLLAFLNPMTAPIELFHFALLNFSPTNLTAWLVSGCFSVVTIVVGWIIFKKESPHFSDWV